MRSNDGRVAIPHEVERDLLPFLMEHRDTLPSILRRWVVERIAVHAARDSGHDLVNVLGLPPSTSTLPEEPHHPALDGTMVRMQDALTPTNDPSRSHLPPSETGNSTPRSDTEVIQQSAHPEPSSSAASLAAVSLRQSSVAEESAPQAVQPAPLAESQTA
ncbi:hypothetical protein EIP91_003281 [Steccherinum ochraceum]|uniref:Uncharacterized protein n=1 Tax=Steccherinum ochraceum TaxID=92696 RepID=A0A4R0RJC1_9APHY|nr:hypothetical protein EIP91_003281 [Steccherinum ochraceum]